MAARKEFLKRRGHPEWVLLGVILLAMITALRPAGAVQAAELLQRSVTVSSGQPSANVTNLFQFVYQSTSQLGSIKFEYCSNSPLFQLQCDVPAGLDVTNASLDSQSGNTGFNIDSVDTTANKLVISRGLAAAASVPTSYLFSNITNPSTGNQAVYVRISSFATADATGPSTDSGSVAFSTVSPFNVGLDVPPFVKLCVGITVSANCSTANGNSLNLGILSASRTAAGTSQFAGGTNAISGYSIFAMGTTLTSGNYVINSLNTPSASRTGRPQFGINLKANNSPPIGVDPTGPGTAAPTAAYGTPNQYLFNSGDLIASANLPSDYKKMTVSYIANIPSGQALGVYVATLTYMATAQF